MSMYECQECGEEHGNFAGVMLAVNTLDYNFPYHESEFEVEYSRIYRENNLNGYDVMGHPIYSDTQKAWDLFYAWLGAKKMKWFCNSECAALYLQKLIERR